MLIDVYHAEASYPGCGTPPQTLWGVTHWDDDPMRSWQSTVGVWAEKAGSEETLLTLLEREIVQAPPGR